MNDDYKTAATAVSPSTTDAVRSRLNDSMQILDDLYKKLEETHNFLFGEELRAENSDKTIEKAPPSGQMGMMADAAQIVLARSKRCLDMATRIKQRI